MLAEITISGRNAQVPPRPVHFFAPREIKSTGAVLRRSEDGYPTKSHLPRRLAGRVILQVIAVKSRLSAVACALCAAATPRAQNQVGRAAALLGLERGVQHLAPARTRARSACLATAAVGGSGRKSGGSNVYKLTADISAVLLVDRFLLVRRSRSRFHILIIFLFSRPRTP